MQKETTVRKNLTRREFVHLAGFGAASIYLGSCASILLPNKSSRRVSSLTAAEEEGLSYGPINRTLGDLAPRDFTGDCPDKPHQVLWDKEGFISAHGGKLPPPSEFTEVTVVGGGVSGLLSAYFMRDQKPLVLEQAKRFGGNSRGESWRGMDYTIGAAYLSAIDSDSPLPEFFKEIGIADLVYTRQGGESVYVNGKVYEDIWESGSTPSNQKQFRKVRDYIQDMNDEKNGRFYPEIPPKSSDPLERKRLNELDQISFLENIEKVVGEPLHPHLEELIERYFWSTNSASSTEVSAAAGLNFFASDFGGMTFLPGGNPAIAEGIFNKLGAELGASRLRPSSLVFDVQVVQDGVNIAYLNAEGEIKTVHSKYAILSCPKFVVARLIDDLEPERLRNIGLLRYRSYLVANLLLKSQIKRTFYDILNIENEDEHKLDLARAGREQKISDTTYGNYLAPEGKGTILTLYRALPYEGARGEIYTPGAYDRYRKDFEDEIQRVIYPLLKVSEKDVVDLRITRWGHPLPLSAVGNISSGIVDSIQKPFRDRVYFVEQDNWTLPAFETAFSEARTWTTELRKVMGLYGEDVRH